MKNFHGDELARGQARFFFIFSPNNSGSTVLSQYLAAQLDGYLPPFGNNEGQIVPAVASMMRKGQWDPAQSFDWVFIRRQWEKLSKGQLFIEGSPPNLVRFRDIARVFGDDSSAVSSVCSPYQQIASCLRRYKSAPFDPKKLVAPWVFKASGIRAFREEYPHFPATTYREFTADPTALNRALDLPVVAAQVDGKKGSEAKGIVDQSAAAILFLTADEVEEISEALAPHEDLLRVFGFELMSARDLHDLGAAEPEALALATRRRRDWLAGKRRSNPLTHFIYRMRVLAGR